MPTVKGIDEKEGVVEWRMSNGIPFAVIVRNKEYSSREDGRRLFNRTSTGIFCYNRARGRD